MRTRPQSSGVPAWDVTTPTEVADYRARLSRGENVVDPENWAGRLPASSGIPPRVRLGRDRWFNLLRLLPIGFVLLLVAVAVAQGLRDMPSVQRFIARYPGTLPTPTAQGGHVGAAVVGGIAALREHRVHDLYHPIRPPDPG